MKGTLKEALIDAKVVPVSSATEGLTLLDKGEVDAFSSDQVVLIGHIITRDKSRKKYHLLKDSFSFEPFALGVARGDADFQLVSDRALSKLNRSTQILEIYRKWFGRIARRPPAALGALYQLNATPE